MELRRRDLVKSKWLILFALWLSQGGVALFQFVRNPAFAFSLKHLSVCLIICLCMGLCVFLMISFYKRAYVWSLWSDFFENEKAESLTLMALFVILGLRGVVWYVRSLFSSHLFAQFGGYIDILNPLLNLIALNAFELLLLLIYFKLQRGYINGRSLWGWLTDFAVIYLFMLLIAGIVMRTKLGILPIHQGDWARGLPAVPLLEWQILLACALGALIILCQRPVKIFNEKIRLILTCALIWLITCVVWFHEPVLPSASLLAPRAPNFELYPFIDAQTYDEASQSILIGSGFGASNVPQRPLYIVFLAFIHWITGQNYMQAIFLQSLFFAFFPVALYLLGRELFGLPFGMGLATLAILRDYTSGFVAPFTGNISYSKLFLSEIPTALTLVLALWIGIRWIKSNFAPRLGFILGGCIGIGMLIRTQVAVVLPFLIVFSLIVYYRKYKTIISRTLIVLISLSLLVGPWLLRNWKLTGGVIFDNPESQTGNLALRYSRLTGVELDAPRLDGETSLQFAARLRQIAFTAIKQNPALAARAVTSAFLNHAINNVLAFPLRNNVSGFNEFWMPSEAFWEQWEGAPTPSQSLVLSFYLLLLSLGIGVAWRRHRWIGLLPLGLNLIYNLWTSVALLSGQRFMLSMDWSIYLYYLTGLYALLNGVIFVIVPERVKLLNPPTEVEQIGLRASSAYYAFFGVFFLLIGLSLPASETLIPAKYPAQSKAQTIDSLLNSLDDQETQATAACFRRTLNLHDLQILSGRALYPRYYPAGEGEDFTDAIGYKAVNQNRLVFDIVGQKNGRVIFPVAQYPDFFPHASDITLVYNSNQELWFILVSQNQNERFYVSDRFDLSLCK